MKKVLYLTNTEVPYRVTFFNQLSKYCDLTVVYERKKSENRDEKWSREVKGNYKKIYLKGINYKDEATFSFGIIKEILKDYDIIIVGCYNNLTQMLAMLVMRAMKKNFYINLDGEIFCSKNNLKTKIKKFFLRGAEKYLVAGKSNVKLIKNLFPDKEIIPYYFSSLTSEEIKENSENRNLLKGNKILVVGQYLYCKGLDIAVKVAKLNPDKNFEFIGMGSKTELFIKEQNLQNNVNIEVIPFLSRAELYKKYRECKAIILPSRQECWGLVINEAASFGTPIISTFGSGGAVEFLNEEYSKFLSEEDNVSSLSDILQKFYSDGNIGRYSSYLLEKSRKYTIEKNVEIHLKACNII